MGVAFTDAQADRLQGFIGAERPSLIVATDADRAGQLAAHRIFWQLTARGDDPRHLAVSTGKDPAELLHTSGPEALRQALATAPSLASALIEGRVATYADRLDTVEGQVSATRRAAEVIAALPTTRWPALLTEVVARTGIAPDIARSEVFDAVKRCAGTARVQGGTRRADPVADRVPTPHASTAGLPATEEEPKPLAHSLHAVQPAAYRRRHTAKETARHR